MELQEAKQILRNGWEKGVDCPCCGQFVKRYKRKISASSCAGLINLYRFNQKKEGAYHVRDIMSGAVDYGAYDFNKLKFYGFIEKKELSPEEKESGQKKSSGYYYITEKGKLFVEGKITVDMYVIVYDDKLLGFEGEQVDIVTALGHKFNYREMMCA